MVKPFANQDYSTIFTDYLVNSLRLYSTSLHEIVKKGPNFVLLRREHKLLILIHCLR